MRYYAVNSDPETPLVGSSYIALSQEDFTSAKLLARLTYLLGLLMTTRAPPLKPVHSQLSLYHKAHTPGLM